MFSCSGQPGTKQTESTSHEIWDGLLKKHVEPTGMVDYKGFISDSIQLNAYLDILSEGSPDPKSYSREARLAYWINAYNAFTVKLIVDNYPLESIKDLNPTVAIPMVSTIWNKKFFSIGGEKMSLDNIEHDILRKEFNEPRIHFAINCASISCPPLRSEAYLAERLEQQLEEQASMFINDPERNVLTPDNPEISKIFSWFSGDFKKNQSLIEFLNKYANTKINEDADIDYMDYDWRLNQAD
jgi:hypothetical protein